MAKTRSQSAISQVKKETCNNTRLLNKVIKRSTPKNKRNLLHVCQVKIEEEVDSKSLSEAQPNRRKRVVVTEEQVKQLIDYIENKNLSVSAAAKKVNIDKQTAHKYYYRYKKNPKQNPFIQRKQKQRYSYEEVKTLIGYIVDDGMSIREVSRTADVCFSTIQYFYAKYMEDPNHNIPVPGNEPGKRDSMRCTQDQIDSLFRYIIHDKLSVSAASIKAKMGLHTGRRYYAQYLNDPNREIPKPKAYRGIPPKRITQDQINQLIGYIVNDKMTIENASMKANMSERSGGRYYHRYLDDPDRQIPTAWKNDSSCFGESCTQKQVNELIGYIVNDKMSIPAAAAKANMAVYTATIYHHRYIYDPNHNIPVPNKCTERVKKYFTQKDVETLIGYITKDNMSFSVAAAKTNMSVSTARRYYNRYIDDPHRRIPNPKRYNGVRYTEPQISQFIDYIVNDKMSITAASEKMGMSTPTAFKHYQRYLKAAANIKKEK